MQLIDNILAHALGCSRGQRHDRHIREMFSQFFQLAVLRAKVVAPLADAMRFVDGDLRDFPSRRLVKKRLQHQPLRRDVEQAILAAMKPAQARDRFMSI